MRDGKPRQRSKRVTDRALGDAPRQVTELGYLIEFMWLEPDDLLEPGGPDRVVAQADDQPMSRDLAARRIAWKDVTPTVPRMINIRLEGSGTDCGVSKNA